MADDWMTADSPQLADEAARLHTVYIHIPFCARVCPYCDFNVVAGQEELLDRYLEAVCREISEEAPWASVDAVFIGGGTPSRLPARSLGVLLEAVSSRFGIADGAEISLEANPEDWTPRLGGDLVSIGFNRVSFGVQSFDPSVLSYLGRTHGPEDGARAIGAARECGFASVGLDLIFGSPGESTDAWAMTVKRAVGLSPDHVSIYALTVERGTRLSREIAAGAAPPDPDRQADDYELAERLLTAGGLTRYEVSNFAAEGHACLYNLAVWGNGDYLAFGAGAHSHRDGVRRRNVRRVDAYLKRVEAGLGAVHNTDEIGEWSAEIERLMLGLRRTAGVELGEGGKALLATGKGQRLREAGVIGVSEGRLRVLRPLLTDEVVREVLALAPPV